MKMTSTCGENESNNNNDDIIKELVNKIPVMGHIGYTPQFKKFKIEGETFFKAKAFKRSFIN